MKRMMVVILILSCDEYPSKMNNNKMYGETIGWDLILSIVNSLVNWMWFSIGGSPCLHPEDLFLCLLICNVSIGRFLSNRRLENVFKMFYDLECM